jgi:hypothetical protein
MKKPLRSLVSRYRVDFKAKKLYADGFLVWLLYGLLVRFSGLEAFLRALRGSRPLQRLVRLRAVSSKSSLSHRLAHLPPAFGESLLRTYRTLCFPRGVTSAVRYVDFIVFSISGKLRGGATHIHQFARGIKIMVSIAPGSPVYPDASLYRGGEPSDLAMLRLLRLRKGLLYVFDRGPLCYDLFDYFSDNHAHILIRAKADTQSSGLEHRALSDADRENHVLDDAIVLLGCPRRAKRPRVRLITVRKKDGEPLWLLTNDLRRPARVLAQIYRGRRHIEQFFDILKNYCAGNHFYNFSDRGLYWMFLLMVLVYLVLAHQRTFSNDTTCYGWLLSALHQLGIYAACRRNNRRKKAAYWASRKYHIRAP